MLNENMMSKWLSEGISDEAELQSCSAVSNLAMGRSCRGFTFISLASVLKMRPG